MALSVRGVAVKKQSAKATDRAWDVRASFSDRPYGCVVLYIARRSTHRAFPEVKWQRENVLRIDHHATVQGPVGIRISGDDPWIHVEKL